MNETRYYVENIKKLEIVEYLSGQALAVADEILAHAAGDTVVVSSVDGTIFNSGTATYFRILDGNDNIILYGGLDGRYYLEATMQFHMDSFVVSTGTAYAKLSFEKTLEDFEW